MADDPMTCEELDALVRTLDPRARVVPPRVIRRVARREHGAGLLGLHVAHRKSLAIATEAALGVVAADDLGLNGDDPPNRLLLIAEPDDDLTPSAAPAWAWRRVFHEAVHEAVTSANLDASAVAARVVAIGAREFAEARDVLERDGWLTSPLDDAETYEEFAAVYLELKQFAPELLPTYFPGIDDAERVESVFAQDVDGPRLFAAVRPEAIADPAPHPVVDSLKAVRTGPETDDVPARSEVRARWLTRRADRARTLGNVVRSAILRTRAARLVGPTLSGQARSAATEDIGDLARRLGDAVGIEPTREAEHALASLLARTPRAVWTPEARLLYDLQSVCIDHEREVYELDLLRWAFSLGRRPLKRPLPNQRLSRMSRHLRRAAARLPKVTLTEEDRHALSGLIHEARAAAESSLRARFRPLVDRSLQLAGLRAENLPEAVSLERMIDELLDTLVERDHLTMGDVRDAIARSDLREPDLSGPRDLLRGDRVLQANRRLKVSLNGVYRSGEVYLRTLQRASFLAFGTKAGRWLTRYVVLPFGGAFGLLFTVQEVVEIGQKTAETLGGHHGHHVAITNAWSVAVVGLILLALIYSREARRYAWHLVAQLGLGLKRILIDAPAWVVSRPLVQRVLKSRAFDLARRGILQPIALGAAAAGIVYWIDGDRWVAVGIGLVTFVVTALFLGTPFGREAEERAADATLRGLRRVRTDLLPGLFRLITDLFHAALEGVEAVLYAVDERLRFREGQARWLLIAKAGAAVVWGVVTYIVRIYINLLVEPTINPLKHFPTVTVAAKLIIPMLGPLYSTIAGALSFLGVWLAGALASLTVVFLPGLAGFVVWELKENWRLFRANRPRELRPVVIGHHGETMRRLLRPGFHSGTIPKLFAKLRKAERVAHATGQQAKARKAHLALHHVEGSIRHFAERGFLGLFDRCDGGAVELDIASVSLATNRVRVEFRERGGDGRLRVDFVEHGDCLAALVADLGFRAKLDDAARSALDAGLVGMAARAGAVAIGGDVDPPPDLAEPRPETPTDSCPPIRVPWPRWVHFWDHAEVACGPEPSAP